MTSVLLYRPDYSEPSLVWITLQPVGRVFRILDPLDPRFSQWVPIATFEPTGIVRHTTHPRFMICTRAVAERDFPDVLAEYDRRQRAGEDAAWAAAHEAARALPHGEERYQAYRAADRLKLDWRRKSWGVIKVGASRWYWTAEFPCRNSLEWNDLAAETADGRIIAEGFATSQADAVKDARAAADAVPGFYDPLSPPDGSGHGLMRERYRQLYTRKPKLSDATDTRLEGALGYLHEGAIYWDSGWRTYPITKITAKRVFIRKGESQLSFDRATLERDGCAYRGNGTGSSFFYTDARKAADEAETAQRQATQVGQFPLLGLSQGFQRSDVLRAFRARAHDAHPDKGGDAGVFRALVAERDQALRQAAQGER